MKESKSIKKETVGNNISKTISTIDSTNISGLIYHIRGQEVLLDSDLAKIYGYTTKTFNQQVKNNRNRFDDDFMFQLTNEEVIELSRSKILTSIQTKGTKGGRTYLPYAFTEQGVYMLMTILKGELAIRQSKELIRIFKSMKNFIINNQEMINYNNSLKIIAQTSDNTRDVAIIKKEISEIDSKIKDISSKIKNVVMKNELSPILLNFNTANQPKEILIMDGEPAKADEVYLDIYSKAVKTIIIIDNYIDIKSLRLLRKTKNGINITIFSDNLGNYLHESDYCDFKRAIKNAVAELFRNPKIVFKK